MHKGINKPLMAAQLDSRKFMLRSSLALTGLGLFGGTAYFWSALVVALGVAASWAEALILTVTQPLFGQKMLVVTGGVTAVLAAAFALVATGLSRVGIVAESRLFKGLLFVAAIGSVITLVQTFAVMVSLSEYWDVLATCLFLVLLAVTVLFSYMCWDSLERKIPMRWARGAVTVPSIQGVGVALVAANLLTVGRQPDGYMLIVSLLNFVNAVMMAGMNAAQNAYYDYLSESLRRVANAEKWVNHPYYSIAKSLESSGGDLPNHTQVIPVSYDDASLSVRVRRQEDGWEVEVDYDDFRTYFRKGIPEPEELTESQDTDS